MHFTVLLTCASKHIIKNRKAPCIPTYHSEMQEARTNHHEGAGSLIIAGSLYENKEENMELVEYRNNVYYVHGRQLANISDVIDTMTLIRYALENEDGVDRGVIKAAVSLAQDALNDVFDQIQEHQEVTGREAAQHG